MIEIVKFFFGKIAWRSTPRRLNDAWSAASSSSRSISSSWPGGRRDHHRALADAGEDRRWPDHPGRTRTAYGPGARDRLRSDPALVFAIASDWPDCRRPPRPDRELSADMGLLMIIFAFVTWWWRHGQLLGRLLVGC